MNLIESYSNSVLTKHIMQTLRTSLDQCNFLPLFAQSIIIALGIFFCFCHLGVGYLSLRFNLNSISSQIGLIHCMLGYFACFITVYYFNYLKKIRNRIRVANSLVL